MMTPFEIKILLHYYGCTDDPPVVMDNPPIWPITRDRFLAEELIEVHPSESARDATYRLTSRGRVYCEALQRVPLPSQQWVVAWPTGDE